jgi:hypothetical protein
MAHARQACEKQAGGGGATGRHGGCKGAARPREERAVACMLSAQADSTATAQLVCGRAAWPRTWRARCPGGCPCAQRGVVSDATSHMTAARPADAAYAARSRATRCPGAVHRGPAQRWRGNAGLAEPRAAGSASPTAEDRCAAGRERLPLRGWRPPGARARTADAAACRDVYSRPAARCGALAKPGSFFAIAVR